MDALDRLPCPVLVTNAVGRVLFPNSDMLTLVGHDAAHWRQKPMEDLFPPAGRIFLQTHVWPMLLRQNRVREIYLYISNAQGERTPVLVNCQSGEHEDQPCYYWVFFVAQERSRFEAELLKARAEAQRSADRLTQVNAELEAVHSQLAQRAYNIEIANRELAVLSRSDPLTGLGNRRALSTAIKRWQSRSDDDALASILLIDVDHFKAVNDHHGHDEGDRVLVALARMLEASLGPNDLAVRYGGEEFALWLPSADRTQAGMTAERVHDGVQQVLIKDKPITVSIGIATLGNSAGSALMQQLLELSDIAVYQAKTTGRNRTVYSTQPSSADQDYTDQAG